MTAGADTAGRAPAAPAMSVFERYLTVWVLLCIVAGIALSMCALSLARVETWPSNAEVITPTDLAAFQECLDRGASPQQPCVLPVAPAGWQIRVE